MDSGNSGSMQSSSNGGDEEYDSRGESFTSFLNSSAQFGSISDHHQPPPLFLSHPHHQQQQQSHQYQSTLFNPSSQNLDAFAHSSANTQYGNDDLVWSRGLRSQTNHHPNFENLIPNLSSSSSSSSNQSILPASQMLNNQHQFAPSSMTSQSPEENPPRSGANQQAEQPTNAKNPRKRTRASRRAPTTVLTTDTTNFQQMVQEFTGIPTAPFSSAPYSRRLDLFSGGGSGMRSGNLDSLSPLYPLRPSAQKAQMSPFLAQPSTSSLLSSTMIEALVSSTNTVNQGTTNNASGTTPDLGGLPKQPQNLQNMQNQILSFQQPILQPLKNSMGTTKPQNVTTGVSVTSQNLGKPQNVTTGLPVTSQNLGPRDVTNVQGVTVPSFDDLGFRHDNVNANVNIGNIQRWRDGGNLNREEHHQELGAFDSNKVISSSNISGNYKFNCSGATSDKGLENVSSSGEGTVGPWFSPSDH